MQTSQNHWIQSECSDQRYTQAIHDGDGLITRRPFFRDTSSLPINIEVWELEPGASEGAHTHSGDGSLEEIYYFLQGTGEMDIEKEVVPIKSGDAIMVPPGVDHGFRNTGEGVLKLIISWGKPTE